MTQLPAVLVFINIICTVLCKVDNLDLNSLIFQTKSFVIWKNATVPFYVNHEHFDHEQILSILSALSMFAFKTCIKFMPVMTPPTSNEEVLVFENPDGTRRCNVHTHGHSFAGPHLVETGYDCLKPPEIEMIIMKALGFTFEHNRVNRDQYIDVLFENIEPGAIELFTKEAVLPVEQRFLPYDVNSAMHFNARDYSKNGHRTIIFKDPNVQQNRQGLSPIDLKKIEIVYGPECLARDRQEKIELCQSYPGVARKKREVESDTTPHPINVLRLKRDVNDEELASRSLRVNPEITPPPAQTVDNITRTLEELGIHNEVQEILENAYKVSALALKNAREKYCGSNGTKPGIKPKEKEGGTKINRESSDALGILEVVTDYARDMVETAVVNLTKFCEESGSIEIYQRARCNWNSGDRCRQTYRSTKSGAVKYSTQHRPVYFQSTKNIGNGAHKFAHYGRSGNDSVDLAETTARRKREIQVTTESVKKEEPNAEASKTSEIVETSKLEQPSKEDKRKAEEVTKENKEIPKQKEVATEKETNVGEGKEKTPQAVKEDTKVPVEDKEDDRLKVNGKEILRMKTLQPRRIEAKRRFNKAKSQRIVREVSDESENEKIKAKKHNREENGERELLKEQAWKKRPREEREQRKQPKNNREVRQRPKEKKHYKEESRRPVDKVEDRNTPRDHREGKERSKVQREERKRPNDREEWPKKHNEKNLGRQKERDVKEKSKNRDRDNEEDRPDKPRTPKKKDRKEKMGSVPRTVKLSKANQEFYNERTWPGGVVWYMIQEADSFTKNDISFLRRRLKEVNDILKRKTCVKLQEITPGQANKYEDYIVIDNSPDYVTGRVGGRQRFGSVELFRGDQHRQHTAMMVMAMLGFYFEVSRHDRDKYVRVHMRHVRPDKLHHFEMIRSDATLPLPYDYESATHPAWQFWRQLGRTGISTVATFKEQDPDGAIMKSFGQNEKLLSDTDIIKINSVYGVKCFQNSRSQRVQEYIKEAEK